MRDLKQNFTLRALEEYNDEVINEMQMLMAKKRVGKSGASENSFKSNQKENSTGGTSELIFNESLRYVDMGAGKGNPIGGLKAMSVSLQSSRKTGLAQITNKTRRPKKIYAKVIFGRLTTLQNRLLYGYTEKTIAILKEELENQPG